MFLFFFIDNIDFKKLVEKFRIVIFLFCYMVIFYIFGGEGFYKDIFTFILSFFCLEICFISIFFFRGLKRKKI